MGSALLSCFAGDAQPPWISAGLWKVTLTLWLVTGTTVTLGAIGHLVGRREEWLVSTAITDPLTGLANRRYLEARLREELERARRHGIGAALLIIDVDGLKRVNDALGHAAGDKLLRAVGDALRGACRRMDLAARWGGDEFLVLAPRTSAVRAGALAQRIHRSLKRRAPELAAAGLPTPSVCIGVTDLGLAGSFVPAEVLLAADRALYVAKANGSGRTSVTPPPPLRLARQRRIGGALRRLVSRG